MMMGEAKQRAERDATRNKLVEALYKHLIDSGQPVEAGWAIMKMIEWPELDAGPEYDARRMAFFAGAQHLFSSIIQTLDPGEEPTETDMRRLNLVSEELEKWAEEMKLRWVKPGGTG
jgi:hypothetical protein